jgi:Tol biopolymer transport system component
MWRIVADGRSEPQRVAGALEGGIFPAIFHPAKGPGLLAYAQVVNDTNIWRMEIAADTGGRVQGKGDPEAVVASTRADITPQFSPDGSRLAFSSDRDGYREIWVSAAEGSGQSQITTLKSTRSSSPRWSPDGRQLVFDSLVSGNDDIWIVSSEGGPPKRLPNEPSDDARPSWSRDGQWIYFRSDRSGSRQIWKIPSQEPYRPAVQVTRNGGFDAIDSLDGKTLYYTKEPSGLWSMNLETGEETNLRLPVVAGNWGVAADGIWFLDVLHRAPDRQTPLQWFSLGSRKRSQVAVFPRVMGGTTPQFAVTPDGRWVAWTQGDHQDSDLMLIENFR